MNTQATRNNDRLLFWIGITLLLLSFGFGDTAIVAAAARVVTAGQLAAAALAFLLIGSGLLFTAWQIRR